METIRAGNENYRNLRIAGFSQNIEMIMKSKKANGRGMKYQFNEQDLLSLFYDKENDMRPDMAAPYLKNGYVCATEGHIMIRIKAETLNGEYNEIDSLNIDLPADNCNFIIGLHDIKTAIASIPQVEEKEKVGKDIECKECDGAGEVEWEYRDKSWRYHHKYLDCPKCQGDGCISRVKYKKTGRMIPDGDCPIRIRRIVIKVEFLEILGRAMEIIGVDKVRCVHQEPTQPCIFRVDDNIEIIIMPYLAVADYSIEGRDAE